MVGIPLTVSRTISILVKLQVHWLVTKVSTDFQTVIKHRIWNIFVLISSGSHFKFRNLTKLKLIIKIVLPERKNLLILEECYTSFVQIINLNAANNLKIKFIFLNYLFLGVQDMLIAISNLGHSVTIFYTLEIIFKEE